MAYSFSLDSFRITDTRSLHKDTDYVSISLAVGSTPPVTKVKKMGDLNNGTFKTGLLFDNVPVADTAPVVFTYTIVNNGHGSQANVEKALQQTPHAEQTAELAIDDLGLDLNSLDTVDQPALGAGADAPTMVAGLDEHSRRLLETAEQRGPAFGMDPSETPTGSWQFDGSATDAPISIEGAEHDTGATALGIAHGHPPRRRALDRVTQPRVRGAAALVDIGELERRFDEMALDEIGRVAQQIAQRCTPNQRRQLFHGAREIPCVNERVFRLSAPLHTALPRPVEPTRALVSGEAE